MCVKTVGTPLLIAILPVSLLGGCEQIDPPDLNKVQVYESRTMSLEYPAEWRIRSRPEEHLPNWIVQFEPKHGKNVILQLLHANGDPIQIFRNRCEDLARKDHTLSEPGLFQTWGPFSGVGHVVVDTAQGQSAEWRHFVHEITPLCWLEVETVAGNESAEHVRIGVEYILRSLRLRPFDGVAPSADRTIAHEDKFCTFEYPEEWFFHVNDLGERVVQPWQDAVIAIAFIECPSQPEEIVREILGRITPSKNPRAVGRVDEWAGLEGDGAISHARDDEGEYEVLCFVHALGDGSFLEIQRMTRLKDIGFLHPGYDIIESSFHLIPNEED